jgi:hypothetical protein
VADEKHGSAVRDSDGVKPASVQLFVAHVEDPFRASACSGELQFAAEFSEAGDLVAGQGEFS